MSLFEFYYLCLAANSSSELLSLCKKYQWFFKKLKPNAQQQIRNLYKIYKNREDEIYK